MNVITTALPDVLLLEPRVFSDARGFFYESFNARALVADAGISASFVQDNRSRSARGVLRGLHYQISQAQGKLVQVTTGEVFDVVVDLRKSSPCFGQWVGLKLSAENKHMVWIPPGFAHGLLVVSEVAELFYKTTDYYAPEHERSILWNDADLAIDWPLHGEPVLSEKDRRGSTLKDADCFA